MIIDCLRHFPIFFKLLISYFFTLLFIDSYLQKVSCAGVGWDLLGQCSGLRREEENTAGAWLKLIFLVNYWFHLVLLCVSLSCPSFTLWSVLCGSELACWLWRQCAQRLVQCFMCLFLWRCRVSGSAPSTCPPGMWWAGESMLGLSHSSSVSGSGRKNTEAFDQRTLGIDSVSLMELFWVSFAACCCFAPVTLQETVYNSKLFFLESRHGGYNYMGTAHSDAKQSKFSFKLPYIFAFVV